MLLQKLREYSDRLELPPTLYSEGPARYIVELDGDGRLLNRHLTDLADPSSPRTKRGQRRLLPQIQRSSGIKPLLLADKADYVFCDVGQGICGKRRVLVGEDPEAPTSRFPGMGELQERGRRHVLVAGTEWAALQVGGHRHLPLALPDLVGPGAAP